MTSFIKSLSIHFNTIEELRIHLKQFDDPCEAWKFLQRLNFNNLSEEIKMNELITLINKLADLVEEKIEQGEICECF
jgi:hypothetical protein